MNAAIEARTVILQGALESNTRPPPADGQFPPRGAGDDGDGGDGAVSAA